MPDIISMKMFNIVQDYKVYKENINKDGSFLYYALGNNLFYFVFENFIYRAEIMKINDKRIIKQLRLIDGIIYKNIDNKIMQKILNDDGVYGSVKLKNNELIFT